MDGPLALSGSASLTLAARAPAPDPHVLRTQSVSLEGSSVINVADNAVIVDYTDARSPQLDAIQALINSGRAGGLWNGPGLTSSSAASANPKNTTLGAMDALEFKSIYGPNALFAGQPIDDSAVLVKYTYYGDADFNGVVDFDDYSRTDAGFNNNRTGWLNGDFDGNGSINFDDYALIDLAFNTQSGTLRPAGVLPPRSPSIGATPPSGGR